MSVHQIKLVYGCHHFTEPVVLLEYADEIIAKAKKDLCPYCRDQQIIERAEIEREERRKAMIRKKIAERNKTKLP